MTLSKGTKKSVKTPKPFKKLYGASFIEEYGRIESARARRFGTTYSILIIEPTGLDLIAQGAKESLDDVSRKAKKFISIIIGTLRDCDIVALTSTNRLMVLLPQTDYFGAFVLVRKLKRGTGSFCKGEAGLSVLYTHSTFGIDGLVFGELLDCNESRALLQRESLWERLGLEDKLFWEIVGNLFAEPHSDNYNTTFDAGQGYDLSEFFMDRVNELIIHEIKRAPRRRGILYFSTGKINNSLPIIKAIADIGMTDTKIFLIGEQVDEEVNLGNSLPIYLDDPRLNETSFTIFLNEDFGYALFTRENWGAAFSCYHTSDLFLVEGLINKFQREYSLQEQL